jgi:hypothetical protein
MRLGVFLTCTTSGALLANNLWLRTCNVATRCHAAYAPNMALTIAMLLLAAMQQLRELRADAVMGMALPGSDPTGDSCGCMLSHALGIDSVVVNGCPLLQAPLKVPQVRCCVPSSAT